MFFFYYILYFYTIFPSVVSGKSAVISNGDCKQTSSFEAGYSSGKIYNEGKSTQNNVVSTGLAVSSIKRNNCNCNF